MTDLNGWENFYVIVGSSAGALIGLQFVVLALIAERPVFRMAEASAAFATPSVVHFGAVLLLSAMVSAPWSDVAVIAILWGLLGVCGMVYVFIVTRRMQKQTVYKPEFEDWLFHSLLPLVSYAVLTISAIAAVSHAREALYATGAAALALLLIGIHNAWDAVTYHVFVTNAQKRKEGKEGPRNAEPDND